LRDDRHRSGRKTLAQRAKSGDLEVKRQATWRMSVDTSAACAIRILEQCFDEIMGWQCEGS
jgi:hypothetical protein